jgi:serralysin
MANDTPVEGQDPTPKGGLFSSAFNIAQVPNANTRAVLSGFFWATSFNGPRAAAAITYAFPTATTDYTSVPGGYVGEDNLAGFGVLTDAQKNAARTGFDLVSSYTNLTFNEVSSGLAADAAIRVARSGKGSAAYYPQDGQVAGDTFIGSNGEVPAQYFGTDGFLTIIHELGHALGLKHGHFETLNPPAPNQTVALAPEFNDNEFSVMTYASYLGSPIVPTAPLPTAAQNGSSPQSYMMYDIAALQLLYGANFSKAGTTAVYRWDPATGQEYLNGQPAPSTGTTATNTIFSTVWTMGAVATFDLSNFNQNQLDDLRPGRWLRFSDPQLADLNNQSIDPQFIAQGNVYNALLYNNDLRSEISTLTTGNGNNTVWGNDVDDTITTGTGTDTIYAGSGNDTISAGGGADLVYFGTGRDVLRDTLADLNGDTVFNFGFKGALDVLGVRIGRDNITVAADHATLSVGGSTMTMNGSFAGGEFLDAARGSGAGAQTTLAFVQYLPTLVEGVSVAPSAINGIASQAFLTGDGSTGFSVDFKSGVSAYANEVGYYAVGADGTISNVHILFGNTHNVAAPHQDLGVMGNNGRLGFFLVQNGFNLYGSLPDDLSFVTQATGKAANADAGQPLILQSATLGQLTAGLVFHSISSLNPGGADQVLSGLLPGGRDLMVGFEDLPKGTGDRDYNDVVLGVSARTA